MLYWKNCIFTPKCLSTLPLTWHETMPLQVNHRRILHVRNCLTHKTNITCRRVDLDVDASLWPEEKGPHWHQPDVPGRAPGFHHEGLGSDPFSWGHVHTQRLQQAVHQRHLHHCWSCTRCRGPVCCHPRIWFQYPSTFLVDSEEAAPFGAGVVTIWLRWGRKMFVQYLRKSDLHEGIFPDAFIQSNLHPVSHTYGRVTHARRQQAPQQQSGWGTPRHSARRRRRSY